MRKSAIKYDVFICHASEDKDSLVRPLAGALKDANLEVWYDESTLKLGDSLRRAIDNGLSQSRYGIVVLSPAFFEKRWPQEELDGLVNREISDGQKVILPIWHGVTHEYVAARSLLLAGKVAVSTHQGLAVVVSRILEVVQLSPALITDESGIAEAVLEATLGSSLGVSTITGIVNRASGPNILLTHQITIVGAPSFLSIDLSPRNLICGESATISMAVKDAIGQNVWDGIQVSLSTNPGGSLVPDLVNLKNGSGSTTLITSSAHVGPYTVLARVEGVAGQIQAQVTAVAVALPE